MLAPDLLRVPAGTGALHVARWGHAASHVVLVHGFGTCGFVWREVGPALALGGHTAYAIDLLGHGESDRPVDAEFGLAAQAEALDRAIVTLRLPRVALVGLDLGGLVALRLAASRPERVERLVLVNPWTPAATPPDDVNAMQPDAARFALRISQGLLGAAPLLEELFARWTRPGASWPAGLVARYLAPFAGRDGARDLLSLAAALRPDEAAEVDPGAVESPTLVLRGAQERWLARDAAEALAAALPHGRLETWPDVGRLIPEEAPQALAERILAFARERRAPRVTAPRASRRTAVADG